MKILGVSSCFMYPDKNRLVFGPKTLLYLEKDMANFLARTDVMPVLVPELREAEMDSFIDHCDGFVFQGGTDISPQSYGEIPILENRWPGDPVRDAYELKLMKKAIERNKPVFGICRGFQLMNVFFGGTLFQDIKTQRADSIIHRDAEKYDQLAHAIDFTKGGLFEGLHTNGVSRVNSVHHQAINNLGESLTIQATCSEDGIVEAFTWDNCEEGKVMAVQWHPEFFSNYSGEGLINGSAVYDHFLQFL